VILADQGRIAELALRCVARHLFRLAAIHAHLRFLAR
jgi:hypothetical protein